MLQTGPADWALEVALPTGPFLYSFILFKRSAPVLSATLESGSQRSAVLPKPTWGAPAVELHSDRTPTWDRSRIRLATAPLQAGSMGQTPVIQRRAPARPQLPNAAHTDQSSAHSQAVTG